MAGEWAAAITIGGDNDTATLAITKAGAGVNTTLAVIDGAAMVLLGVAVEGRLCALTRKDWVTNYATQSTNIKNILEDTFTSMLAVEMAQYDQTGYYIGEYQMTINVQSDIADAGIRYLKDFKATEIKTPSP